MSCLFQACLRRTVSLLVSLVHHPQHVEVGIVLRATGRALRYITSLPRLPLFVAQNIRFVTRATYRVRMLFWHTCRAVVMLFPPLSALILPGEYSSVLAPCPAWCD